MDNGRLTPVSVLPLSPSLGESTVLNQRGSDRPGGGWGLQQPVLGPEQTSFLLTVAEQRSQPACLLVFLAGHGARLAALSNLGLQPKGCTGLFYCPTLLRKQILSPQPCLSGKSGQRTWTAAVLLLQGAGQQPRPPVGHGLWPHITRELAQ